MGDGAGVDEQMMKVIMESMGVTDYSEKVPTLLSEYIRGSVMEILADALDYAKYAGRKQIELADVRLALQSKEAYNTSLLPPRDRMMQVAEVMNLRPIDPIPPDYTISLPSVQHQPGLLTDMLAANYVATTRKSVPAPQAAGEAQSALPPAQEGTAGGRHSRKGDSLKLVLG